MSLCDGTPLTGKNICNTSNNMCSVCLLSGNKYKVDPSLDYSDCSEVQFNKYNKTNLIIFVF